MPLRAASPRARARCAGGRERRRRLRFRPPRRRAPLRRARAPPSSFSRRTSTSPRTASSCMRRALASAVRAVSSSRSSAARPARMRPISSPSFSARSAALAWSARGRRRFCTSRSRSRARSTCCATRASFSSARWRRRLNRPRPAASSTSARRSAGEDDRIASTFPCPTTAPAPGPSPTSASSSTTSARRTVAPLTRYCPSPPRWRRRAIETSSKSIPGSAPATSSKRSSTSQYAAGWRPAAAREEHVIGLLGAELARSKAPGRPEQRVRDVRLPRSVRPDDDRHARLEAHFDGLRKRLEAANGDRAEIHGRPTLTAAADSRCAARQ